MTTTSHDDDHDWEAGGFSMRCISITACSDKHPVRSPMHHFMKLLKEACLNHAYPVRHRLEDYDMMRSFMALGSLT
jgi:hypothetical protein